MDKNSVQWRGYIPAITTPFDRNLRFDEHMLEDLLVWLHAEGMHGIVLAGTTGLPKNIAAYFELIKDFRPELVISDFESWTYLYAKTHRVR